MKKKYFKNSKVRHVFQGNGSLLLDEGGSPTYEKLLSKPIREIWMADNPLHCTCINFHFVDFVKDVFHTKVRLDIRVLGLSYLHILGQKRSFNIENGY